MENEGKWEKDEKLLKLSDVIFSRLLLCFLVYFES